LQRHGRAFGDVERTARAGQHDQSRTARTDVRGAQQLAQGRTAGDRGARGVAPGFRLLRDLTRCMGIPVLNLLSRRALQQIRQRVHDQPPAGM
jgi:hypothetical protein